MSKGSAPRSSSSWKSAAALRLPRRVLLALRRPRRRAPCSASRRPCRTRWDPRRDRAATSRSPRRCRSSADAGCARSTRYRSGGQPRSPPGSSRRLRSRGAGCARPRRSRRRRRRCRCCRARSRDAAAGSAAARSYISVIALPVHVMIPAGEVQESRDQLAARRSAALAAVLRAATAPLRPCPDHGPFERRRSGRGSSSVSLAAVGVFAEGARRAPGIAREDPRDQIGSVEVDRVEEVDRARRGSGRGLRRGRRSWPIRPASRSTCPRGASDRRRARAAHDRLEVAVQRGGVERRVAARRVDGVSGSSRASTDAPCRISISITVAPIPSRWRARSGATMRRRAEARPAIRAAAARCRRSRPAPSPPAAGSLAPRSTSICAIAACPSSAA